MVRYHQALPRGERTHKLDRCCCVTQREPKQTLHFSDVTIPEAPSYLQIPFSAPSAFRMTSLLPWQKAISLQATQASRCILRWIDPFLVERYSAVRAQVNCHYHPRAEHIVHLVESAWYGANRAS